MRQPAVSRFKRFVLSLTAAGSRPCHRQGMQPFTVLVEGNIGSGKTSLIDFYSQNYAARVFPASEPIHKWRNVRGHNLFDLFASDPVKFAFPFQQYVQLTMTQVHRSTPPADAVGMQTKLMERSLFSARYCFVQNLHNSGRMCDAEFAVYDEYFHFLTRDPELRVDLILYLKASPEVCLQRALSRHRKEESKLSLEYLIQLDQLHDKWLLAETSQKAIAPVLTIPADSSKEVLSQIFESIAPFVLGEKRWSGSERRSFLETDQNYSLKMDLQKIRLTRRDENIALN